MYDVIRSMVILIKKLAFSNKVANSNKQGLVYP